MLYTLAPQFERLAPIVADAHRRIEPWLRPASPALTKPLAPGLALAEDPGAGTESFGMNRCRLLAERSSTPPSGGRVGRGTDGGRGRALRAGGNLARAALPAPGSVDSYSLPEVAAGA